MGLSDQISSPSAYIPPEKMNVPSGDALKESEKVKKELEDLKKKILKKFAFTKSLSILPAQFSKFFEEDEGLTKEEIERKPLHLMMVIPEDKFKEIPKKIKPEIVKLVVESKQNVWIHIKTPVDVWNYGLDSKFEMVDAIGGSFPLHDDGFLGAVRVATIHKTLVLRKFEKYVATYAVGGSVVTGTAGKDSDVDTFVIIDDTDVKRMPRAQLLEKLRGWIYDFIKEAQALAGVKNVLNVQVYLLTDFWDAVKDANPVMFTFIRDGVPMYDRGTFLPWKALLQMGKIKPSPEAVDKFMKYGEQNEALVTRRLMDAFVDIYWGVVTPTQALMMLAGHAPPTPKQISGEVKKIFVDKEKIMGMKEWKFLDKTMKMWKDYEHGKMKKIAGAELDKILVEAEEYDKKLKELRAKLESRLIEHSAEQVQEDVFGLLKNILGNKSREMLIKEFEKELVKKGKMQKRFLPVLEEVAQLKKKTKGKIIQAEIDKVKRDATELIKELTDYTQRKEMIAVEKGVIQISFDGKNGEIVVTDAGDFFVESGRIMKISSGKMQVSDGKQMEEAIAKTEDRTSVKIKSETFKILERELGEFTISL